jgi:SAM-dependent methyltransferase
MTLSQDEQNRIWSHYQDHVGGSFDLSYPRLRYLAERCTPPMRVLNIGVGSGYLESLLQRRGVDVCALDPSSITIERIRTELDLGARAQQGYGDNIPFEKGYFDAVIMTEVLEHLQTTTLHATLEEVKRVLRPGGLLIGTVPYREDLASNEVMCPRCQAAFHRWGHEQQFDSASLRSLLQKHDFRIETLYPRAFPDFRRRGVRLWIKALFRYALGRMGEPLVAPNLYFRARTEGTAP